MEKVQRAVEIAKSKMPDTLFEGEMQTDAALAPEVAERKMKETRVQGNANVLIFPDLDAANIGYKLVERLGEARAVGPILQGLAKPVNDLSRGAGVSDIVDVATITATATVQT